MAVQEALSVAGIGLDDVATFDLYSCFPVPVFAICDGVGFATDDPRGLTLTGGLPFFGGPGNNYSMHGIAETVNEMRERPGRFGLVGANGGIMSKYSVGVYSTEPADWTADRSAELCDEVAARPTVPVTTVADGPATIETYSVRYDWPVADRNHHGPPRFRRQPIPGHQRGRGSGRTDVRRRSARRTDRGARYRLRQPR